MSVPSPVFDDIVEDQDDIDGLVAYSLYKRHKREWCREFLDENNRHPDDTEKMNFAKAANTASQRERYRKDAQDALAAFAESIIFEETPEIQRDAIVGRIENSLSKIESQNSFSRQLLNSLISTFITTSVLIILVIGLKIFGIDVIDGINSIAAEKSSENSR